MKLTDCLFCFVLTFSAAGATDVSVSFADADRGPTNFLQIGNDITVSQWGNFGLPATVAGVGLGSAVVGPAGSIDQIYHYSSGAIWPDTGTQGSDGGLSISVLGRIDSITILPYFTVLGSSDQVQLAFPMEFFGGTVPQPFYVYFDPSNPGPITIPINQTATMPTDPSQLGWLGKLDCDIGNDSGPVSIAFTNYRDQNSPDETFEFGFSILSLNYTPIPEPATGDLLGASMLGLLLGRWNRKPRS